MIEQLLSTLKDDSPEGPPGVEFLGEVGVTGFIDGEALATAIDLTAGTSQFTDSPWLHFILDDKTLYVAKKPYRYNLSWNHINDAGAVFGVKTVIINEREYKVRLLKSAVGDVYTGDNGVYDPVEAYGSEWNRLMYPIHSGNHTDANNPSPVSGEGINFGSLARYTDADLALHGTGDSGSYSWCQETPSTDPTRRVYRGRLGVSNLSWLSASNVHSARGWRPVLELI